MVRGGNWTDDFHQNVNGGPSEVLIIRNTQPNANISFKSSYFPFDIIDDTYFIKEKIRSIMSQKFPSENNLNLLHSTDDDIELAFYANILNIPLENIIDDQLITGGSVDDTIN